MALRFLNSGYFAGKVGIGTDSPGAKLDVSDGTIYSIKLSNTAAYNSVINNGIVFNGIYNSSGNNTDMASIRGGKETVNDTDFGGKLTFHTRINGGVDTERMRIDSVGNVGIGTVSPVGKLYVGPTWNTSNNGNNLYIKSSGATNDAYDPQLNNTTNLGITIVRDSATTTGPDTVGLTLYNDDGTAGGFSPMLLFSKLETPTSQFKATMAGIYARSPLGTGNGGSWIDGELIFATAGAATQGIKQRMVINKEGLVGIGTTSPGAKLEIQTLRESAIRLSSSDITAGADELLSAIDFYSNDTGNEGVKASIQVKYGDVAANSYMTLNTGGNTEQVRITKLGNVGMGYATPSDFTSVGADNLVVGPLSGNNGITVNSATTGYGALAFADGTGASDQYRGLIQYNHTTNSLALFTNASTKMTILSGGNVGINTTSPDFKLDVDGTFGVSDLPFNTDSVSALVADEITGVELVTNGDFSNGQTGWSFQTGWAVSNGGATVSTAGVLGRVSQTLSYVANISATTKFRYKFEITNITAGSLRLFVNKPTFTEIANVNAVGKYVYDVEVATGSNGIFYLYSTSSGGSTFQGTVTNVSVKEITPVSNQIQKRELGTGAFGPTPVGAYLPLAGGTMTGDLKLNDNVDLYIGTGDDFQAYHDGSNTYLRNLNGNFIIKQDKVDADLILESDNGSGGTTPYLQLDGSHTQSIAWKDIHFVDGVKAKFGDYASPDLQIYHDGSNSFINETGTGSLVLKTGSLLVRNPSDASMLDAQSGGAINLYYNGSKKFETTSTGVTVTGDIQIDSALLSNQENTDIDTGAEVVAQVAYATYTAAFFDFVVKKGTNVRSGTVYACHNGDTTPLVEFTETSTNDLGDTSDVTLSVDISGGNMRLLATVTSDDWSVKSLIRAI